MLSLKRRLIRRVITGLGQSRRLIYPCHRHYSLRSSRDKRSSCINRRSKLMWKISFRSTQKKTFRLIRLEREIWIGLSCSHSMNSRRVFLRIRQWRTSNTQRSKKTISIARCRKLTRSCITCWIRRLRGLSCRSRRQGITFHTRWRLRMTSQRLAIMGLPQESPIFSIKLLLQT